MLLLHVLGKVERRSLLIPPSLGFLLCSGLEVMEALLTSLPELHTIILSRAFGQCFLYLVISVS